MARECPTPALALNQPRGNWGNAAHPMPAKATPVNNRPHHIPNPTSGQRPASMRAAQWTVQWETTPVIPFLNPDPIAHLVGQSNEAPYNHRWAKGNCINWLGCPSFQYQLWVLWTFNPMEVHPLGRLLELEGTGGSAIPYLEYIEVNLQIPGIKGYNEDVLLLVIPTTTYSKKVPVMVGSKIIDWAMGMMTKRGTHEGNCNLETSSLQLSAMSGSLQLSCTDSARGGQRSGEGGHTLPKLWPYSIQEVLSGWIFRDLSIPLRWLPSLCLGLISIHGNTAMWGHCMWVHVLAKPV